ncbi:amino acid aminotransferase [Mycobacterium intracellulare]|uniref:amino acid aminotransferase n=1 Tax=Mycobacterium intracellulare TaxID=1767 RepID=UPI001CDAA9F4|nr:amino acid aminotransferase [Mycobacterium intracellulare]MCA2253873.1 amino acid aminotransferase [Mycobacterium intracellulare]
MTTAISTAPADPESAALNLIIQAAEAATGSTALRAVLQDLAGALHAEGALAGLAWADARLVAAAVSFDACTAVDPVGSLRRRAAVVRAGRGPRCVDAGVAQALDVAATVLDMM